MQAPGLRCSPQPGLPRLPLPLYHHSSLTSMRALCALCGTAHVPVQQAWASVYSYSYSWALTLPCGGQGASALRLAHLAVRSSVWRCMLRAERMRASVLRARIMICVNTCCVFRQEVEMPPLLSFIHCVRSAAQGPSCLHPLARAPLQGRRACGVVYYCVEDWLLCGANLESMLFMASGGRRHTVNKRTRFFCLLLPLPSCILSL